MKSYANQCPGCGNLRTLNHSLIGWAYYCHNCKWGFGSKRDLENESTMEGKKEMTTHKHYEYKFKGIKIDPYRIFREYKITHPAQQHAIKKLIRAGQSSKDLKTDVLEARDSLDRWLEMIDEETDLETVVGNLPKIDVKEIL